MLIKQTFRIWSLCHCLCITRDMGLSAVFCTKDNFNFPRLISSKLLPLYNLLWFYCLKYCSEGSRRQFYSLLWSNLDFIKQLRSKRTLYLTDRLWHFKLMILDLSEYSLKHVFRGYIWMNWKEEKLNLRTM